MQSMLKPVVTAEQAWKLLEEKVSCRYKSVKVSAARRGGGNARARVRARARRRSAARAPAAAPSSHPAPR